MRELGIPWPFTDWTTSGFWSPEGLTTEAPIFSRRPQLPTMLGQFVHTLPLFRCYDLSLCAQGDAHGATDTSLCQ